MITLEKCSLCPIGCGANRLFSNGYCGAGELPKVARAALHYWEEPCISGRGGSGTVFFSGCSLKCVYCQNYDVSHGNFGKEISVQRLAEIFLELQDRGAENINLVSPTHYCLQIAKALEIAGNSLNIPIVYNTGGYENIETLKFMEKYVDIYITDIKYYSEDLSEKYSGVSDYFSHASAAAKEMVSQKKIYTDENGILKKGVIIRHLVLPFQRKDSFKALDFLKENFDPGDFLLSLMSQYTPNNNLEKYPEINRRVTSFEYNSVVDYAMNLGFKNGFMQNRCSAEKKYTPPFDLTGV